MEEIIEINPRYFASLNGNVIIGYYIDQIHGIDLIPTPHVEITEELWSALTDDSARKEFIESSDIVDGQVYTIDNLGLFQTVASTVVNFPKTEEELALETLRVDVDELSADVDKKSDTMLLTTAEYEVLEANGELKENTIYMLTDDTFEEDLRTQVAIMNNIDYDTYLAFDTTEIV